MKADEFSDVGMYGNRPVFEKKLKAGYTEVSFGSGPWVDEKRIVGIFAFYHPSQNVATFQTPKFFDGSHTVRGNQFEEEYTPADFERYCADRKIRMSRRDDLAKILEQWTE